LEQSAEDLTNLLKKADFGSKEFKKLKQELINVNKEIKNTELGMESLDSEQVASELGSVAGAVGDMSAAFMLLGGSGGPMEETVQNIEKAIGVSMAFKGAIEGTQSAFKLYNNVIKNSAFFQKANNAVTMIATQVMKIFGKSVDKTSFAFKGLKGAIVATGIGALVIGILYVIQNFNKLKIVLGGVTEKQKMLNDSIEDYKRGTIEAVSQTSEMASTFELAKKGVINKEEALQTYNKTLGLSFGKAKNLNEAEALFIEKTNAYIEAQSLRAQSQALFSKAAEEQAESIAVTLKDQKSVIESMFLGVSNVVTKGLDFTTLGTLKLNEASKKASKIVTQAAEENAVSESKARAKSFEGLAKDLLERAILIENESKLISEFDKEQAKSKEKSTKKIKQAATGLIAEQDKLLKQAEKLPETTERELVIKNKKIKAINEEIKRLKELGLEIKKEKPNNEEAQFQLLQQLRNTDQENEIRDLVLQYEKKFELANGNAELEKALKEQQNKDVADIDKKYADKQTEIDNKLKKKKEDDRKADLEAAQAVENAKLQMSVDSISALMNLTSAFAKDNEKSQKRAFEINKKLQIAQAIIQTYQGANAIFASAAANPKTILFPAQPFIAAGLAIVNGLANVATISKQQFQSSSAGSTPSPSFNLGGGGGTAPQLSPVTNTSTIVPQGPTQVYVTETDITNTQNQVAVIQEQATLR
jgi:hypothetical protein